jgi:hypothetical protein
MTEDELQADVERLLKNVLDLIYSNKWNQSIPDHKKMWDEMVSKAVELHKIVKPKHHKYMIENRGIDPDDPEFYNHVHPIEDLLKFIKDPHANDDPEDQTIGHEFTFDVFSRRWGHNDRYRIKRINKGWDVYHIAIGGPCNKEGRPFLYENLDHDSINYPEELPGYMEWLWEQAKELGIPHDQLQESLNQLAEWVNLCEKNSPKGVWEGYK